jgi:hypothetical protein
MSALRTVAWVCRRKFCRGVLEDGRRTDVLMIADGKCVSTEKPLQCPIPLESAGCIGARSCDPLDGRCRLEVKPDGSRCSDSSCKGVCRDGKCDHSAIFSCLPDTIPAEALCRKFECDDLSGQCRSRPVPDGTHCSPSPVCLPSQYSVTDLEHAPTYHC